MPFKSIAVVATLLTIGITSSVSNGVQAAPQILGMVATATPVPLTCAHGRCSVEISAICLQQHRAVPEPNTAYLPTPETEITIIVTGRDGVQRSMAVGDKVEIRSLRGFTSVSISLPEKLVRGLGRPRPRDWRGGDGTEREGQPGQEAGYRQ